MLTVFNHLRQILVELWHWTLSVPVSAKIVGLLVLPLLLSAVVGMQLLSQSLNTVLLENGQTAPLNAETRAMWLQEASIVFYLGAIIGLVVSLFLTWMLVRPLHQLVRAIRQVQAGDLTTQVPVWARDEIGEVQAEFNEMIKRLNEARAISFRQQTELEKLNGDNARLLAELTSRSESLQQLFHRAVTAQEAERQRLARELHDETGQALTAIMLQLKALQDEADLEVIRDRINGLRYLTGQTLDEIRRLAIDLRPATLDDLGLIPAIRRLVEGCAERNQLAITFSAGQSLGRLPPDTELVLYRAVQEGLTNIIRHAQARNAQVTLEYVDRVAILTITDDGTGIDSHRKNGSGLGLAGMRERVMMAGGQLSVISAPRAGTRIVIHLPLQEEP
jgi:signal transduction histidine kinase